MKFSAIVNSILIIVGSFLIGNHFFGITWDIGYWDIVSGGILTIIGGVRSWINKELEEEQKISFIRNTVTFIAGFLLTAGVLTEQLWAQIMGAVASIFQIWLGQALRETNEKIQEGKINTDKLSNFTK